MTCIHGAEHVVSLFLGDVFHLPQLKMLVSFYNRLRNFFGSVRHSPAAMFRKQSKAHNGGAAIGFIKISKTRMGGVLYRTPTSNSLEGCPCCRISFS